MTDATPSVRSHVVTLSDVQVVPVRWLWADRIPYGKLTVVEGDPGLGKSQLTLAVAAAVSTGGGLPGGSGSDATAGEPADVLLMTSEDGLGDTVRPRLEAAGGDPARVHVLQAVPDPERPGQFRFPSLPQDATHLALEVRKRAVRLVIVDTLTTYLGGEVNSFKDADVRRALAPLANVAEATGCAIVLVRHLTKQSRGRAITAGGGSIGIVGGARSCLLLAEDPDDANTRVLAVVKANLTRKPDSLSLAIEEAPSGWPRVSWVGTSTHSADDLIAARGDEEHRDRGKLDDACDLLRQWLVDGPVLQEELERRASQAGISNRTLRRAKGKVGAQSDKQGFGSASRWSWRLPEGDQEPPKVASSPITYEDGHLSGEDGRNALSDMAPTEDGQAPARVAIFGAVSCPECGNPNAIPSPPGAPACPRCDPTAYVAAFKARAA